MHVNACVYAYTCVHTHECLGEGILHFFQCLRSVHHPHLHLIPQQLGLITKKQGPWGSDRVMCVFWGQRTAPVSQLRLSLRRTVGYVAGTREMYVLRVQEAAGVRLRVLAWPCSSEDSLSGLQMASPCVLTRMKTAQDHGAFHRVSSLVSQKNPNCCGLLF